MNKLKWMGTVGLVLLSTVALTVALPGETVPPPVAGKAETTDSKKIQEANPQPAAAPAPNKARINIYGYTEAGYFHDFSAPGSSGPTYIGYNNFKNKVILNKISLNIERAVDPTTKAFDVGFHVEGIYGADAALIHSNGMMDTQTGRNQWDLLQAYVDVTLPELPM
ncbi:MAG TPA: outer membrane beta-barrel protein, partial [Acidobacteriota bacterium]|nr:outer membrane beta-barrel protein [Acidobacteriota bacterium]